MKSSPCVTAEGHGNTWWASWRVTMRLTCFDPHGAPLGPFEDSSNETGFQPKLGEAHELALKSATSGALKRCAMNLGNQFGLSLYAERTRQGPRLVAVTGTLNPPHPHGQAHVEALPTAA
ncbi:Rad52/Rad22 family DNA repair protein [Streptomyces sp. E11-3]